MKEKETTTQVNQYQILQEEEDAQSVYQEIIKDNLKSQKAAETELQ